MFVSEWNFCFTLVWRLIMLNLKTLPLQLIKIFMMVTFWLWNKLFKHIYSVYCINHKMKCFGRWPKWVSQIAVPFQESTVLIVFHFCNTCSICTTKQLSPPTYPYWIHQNIKTFLCAPGLWSDAGSENGILLDCFPPNWKCKSIHVSWKDEELRFRDN